MGLPRLSCDLHNISYRTFPRAPGGRYLELTAQRYGTLVIFDQTCNRLIVANHSPTPSRSGSPTRPPKVVSGTCGSPRAWSSAGRPTTTASD